MNKNILTAAIGAAMIVGPLAAQADFKISGRVAGSLVSKDAVIAYQDFGNSRLQFDASSEGFFARSAMDLRASKYRGGTPVGATVDTYLGPRDQYLGVKFGSSSVSAGRIAGVVKNLEGDPFIATFLELRNGAVKGGKYGSSSFVNNVLQLATKTGATSIKFQFDATTSPGVGSDTGHYSLGVKSKLAGANVFLGYNNLDNTGNTFYKLGGSMKFGDIKGKLYYQSDSDVTRFVLGAEIGLGDGAMVDVSYGDKGGDATVSTYRLAYMKKVSKKARYWAGYSSNGSGTTDVASFGGGLRVDF